MPDRLLVVDDERAVRLAMKRYFELHGLCVDAASEKEEAIALMENRQYDFLVADLRLSGTYGVEGLDLIRFARSQQEGIRIVLLTAYGTAELERDAFAGGADAVRAKPIPLAKLYELLKAEPSGEPAP